MRAANSELSRVGNELASVRSDAARGRRVLAVVLLRDARYIRLFDGARRTAPPRFPGGGASWPVLSGVKVGASPVSAGV